jgi:quercetin dioxygenase-like cupin family protein
MAMPDAPRSVLDGPPAHEFSMAAEHRRPHPPTMASPFLEFDLAAEVDRLHLEGTWHTGRNARTLVKYDDFRVVLTTLRSGIRILEHKTDGRLSFHMLAGHLRLNAVGRAFDLRPGSLVALDQGEPHDLHALDDSTFLLTIAWPGPRDTANGDG